MKSACLSLLLSVTLLACAYAQENPPLPEHIRIWTGDVSAPVRDFDWEAGAKPVAPVRIVGVRNGTFSGKVVIGSTQSIKGVQAKITDLATKGASIPASAVRLSFPPYAARGAWLVAPKAVSEYDDLHAQPQDQELIAKSPDVKRIDFIPVGHAFQPVWVTVKVPANAPAGEYSGRSR